MFDTGPVRSLLYRVCCPSPVWEWTVTARLCPAGRGQAAEAAVWVEATVVVEAPSGRSCRLPRDDSSFLLRQLQLHANSQGRRTEGVVLMAQLLKVKCMRSYLSTTNELTQLFWRWQKQCLCGIEISTRWILKKEILIFSKDALYWSKVSEKLKDVHFKISFNSVNNSE